LDVGWELKLILLLLLFLASAFFSGSEVALFSIEKRKVKNTFKQNSLKSRYLLELLDHPRRLLVTILVGNTLVNVAASIIAVTIALELARGSGFPEDAALSIQIIILTMLVIIFGELIPKVWASKNSISFARFVAIPMYWVSVIIYPVTETLTEAIKGLGSKIKIDKKKSAISTEELSELADLSHELGTIEENEHGIIQSIVEFHSVTVREVMTPRVDMVSVSLDTSFEKMIEVINTSGYSRIPLYKEDLDEIIGIIYVKDLLPYIKEPLKQKSFSPSKIARKPLFVPETKLINDLLHEFQEKKMHIAIAVDEYGGTAGLVTLEDVIEEIIGEIRDEYDKEENAVTKIDANTYLLLGKLPIDELNELLNTNIDSSGEDFETAGGMVLNYAGQIPKEGYAFVLAGYRFTVKEVLNKRIKKVLVEKI
jgi:gliding motility-associated protein GldE